MILRTTRVPTPIGEAWLAVSPHGLVALGFGPRAEPTLGARLARRFPGARFEAERDPEGMRTRLDAYFGGIRGLSGIPCDLGGTPFQAEVWSLLRALPLGARISYAELAARLGRPTAVRAVARANATNPVALVVPCHRVIGKDGALRGYAWGERIKAWLLAHETNFSPEPVARTL